MKPGQSVRVVCQECLVSFDITLSPRDEWPELPVDEDEEDI